MHSDSCLIDIVLKLCFILPSIINYYITKEVSFIANYLLSHYKGIYRVLCEYDRKRNAFPRKLDGAFEDIDCFIACANKTRIYSFGHGVLQAYIPSIGRGRNIIRALKEAFHSEIIFDIEETDSEVLFKFHAKDMDKLERYLKPRTSGSNISPFSSKNLPRNKQYKIPDEELLLYKNIVAKIPRERILDITHRTNDYLKTLVNKKNNWDTIKADMAMKGLKGKEYIHSIGKWSEYIKYLEGSINDNS